VDLSCYSGGGVPRFVEATLLRRGSRDCSNTVIFRERSQVSLSATLTARDVTLDDKSPCVFCLATTTFFPSLRMP